MRQLLGLAAGIAILAIGHQDSAACDRARSPFETVEVAVAAADLVIVAEVTQIDQKVATVKIVDALKGGGKGTAAGDSIAIAGVSPLSVMDRCGGVPIDPGKRYVFVLWSPAGKLTRYHLVDEMGGVLDVGGVSKYKDALAKQHPRSAWKIKGEIATQLVRDPDPANKDDVDVFLVVRNLGDKPIEFKYQDWPRAVQSRCTLAIANVATKKSIAPKDVPISKQDISAYFSKHGRKWQQKLAPGDRHLMRLSRITTAKQGWGYKEELGFVFYPVETPGAHTVSAECANLFGPNTKVTTESMTLAL